jgi:hypothetical protein
MKAMNGLGTLALVMAAACSSASDDTDSGDGALTATSAPATLAASYQGKVDDHDVMFRLDASGAAVTGTYFYVGRPTAGEIISLKGTLSGGKLHLDETTLGKKSGVVDATVSNGEISGQWTKADGTGKLPLALAAIPTGTVLPVTRTIDQTLVPAVPGHTPTNSVCRLSADYIEVFGLADKTVESAINSKLAVQPLKPVTPGKCDLAFQQDVLEEVKLNESGLFVVITHTVLDKPLTSVTTIRTSNFDVKTGKDLVVTDIFKPDAVDALRQLALKSLHLDDMGTVGVPDEMQARNARDQQDEIDRLAKETLASFDSEVTKDGIHVHLDAADFDGTMGAPDTLLPWARVKDLLLPNPLITSLIH